MGYTLENGVEVPVCEAKGCENSNYCGKGEFCSEGKCMVKCCNKVSYSQNSELTLAANSMREGARFGKVGSIAELACTFGHVMKVDGTCKKSSMVTCQTLETENRYPYWNIMMGTQRNILPKCFPGCAEASDCEAQGQKCDPSTCTCKNVLCENSRVSNGIIQVDLDGEVGSTGTLICDPHYKAMCNGEREEASNRLSNVSLLCTDLNPNPEWRTLDEGCIPECSQVPYMETYYHTIHGYKTYNAKNNKKSYNDKQNKECFKSKYYHFLAGRCVARECSRPSVKNSKTILPSSLHGHGIVIGSILRLVCDHGYVMHKRYSGNIPIKATKMVCRYDGITDEVKFSPLDGSINLRCVTGKEFFQSTNKNTSQNLQI